MCENLAVCPRTKTAKANFKTVSVSPTKGPQGTTFNINVEYTVTSQIGTGMIIVQINPPDAGLMQWSETLVALTPSTYAIQLQVQSNPSQGTSKALPALIPHPHTPHKSFTHLDTTLRIFTTQYLGRS